ncbi:hypothetical protein QTO34_009753 [Cnephaeus nilssonii]|uniref:Long-chain-fatty-acid--CoA ligase n=1 Tax=Cnephaeus nilssonii TaxID=3371016 RepID=A0AA40HF84_CNENI|nr:hypothetical protein QTO34_009753 [Eptesicus nilssonii]
MGAGRRSLLLLPLLLLLRGGGLPVWPVAAAPALRWLLGDPACCALVGLAALARPWLWPWAPHGLSLAAAALALALLPPRPPLALRWLPADLAFVAGILRVGLGIRARLGRSPPDTFVDAFERRARAQPGHTPLVWTGRGRRAVTYAELDARACRAAWALKAELVAPEGAGPREPAALLMPSAQAVPALGLWLGLAKLGCPVAWINPHIRGAPLAHSVLSSGARVLLVDPGSLPLTGTGTRDPSVRRPVLYPLSHTGRALGFFTKAQKRPLPAAPSVTSGGFPLAAWKGGLASVSPLVRPADLRENLEEVLPQLQAERVRCFYLGRTSPTPGVGALEPALDAAPSDPVPAGLRAGLTRKSPALFIYTSGTTGLPKPAILTHERVLQMSAMLALSGVTAADVVYTVLPLYHAMGLVLGVLGCLELGATCVLAPKFSASCFWEDCRQHGVTVIQYVGEVLRYLCNAPQVKAPKERLQYKSQRPEDRTHTVRLAMGNGLRADVWEAFQRRFGPIRIFEVYGSTEGNAGFVNYPGRRGAVGKTSCILRALSPFELVQFDTEAAEPVRDGAGFCVPVGPGTWGRGRGLPGKAGTFSSAARGPAPRWCLQLSPDPESPSVRLSVRPLSGPLCPQPLGSDGHPGLSLSSLVRVVESACWNLGREAAGSETPVVVHAASRSRPGEPGLLLTRVLGRNPFLGYRGPRELSERKLVRKVRRPDDIYYNTGDVLSVDREGFLYFHDRLGDTYRCWAGLRGGATGTFRS